MPDGQSLEFAGVTKRFGTVTAVSELTARVEPGRVTGFLGPNGAGKTTSLRILLGLVRATDGHATIGGKRYAELTHPLQTVGAVLEASSFHPGRTAAAHLHVYAQAAGIGNGRVDEVLGLVGLTDAAGRKVGGFSLGMRQRLGLAYALLGDPGVLVLDEPANGLDPEGIRWMRGFTRDLAREGRTVLVSSHLLAEVQQTVDALLILSQGRLVFQGPIEDLADPSEYATVVDSPDRAALVAALQQAGVPFEVLRSGLTVRGVDTATVGAAAAAAGVALSSLQRRGPALEEVFLELVNGVRVHPSATGGAVAASSDAEPAAETMAEPASAPEPQPQGEAPGPLSEGAPATETKRTEATEDAEADAFRLARSSLAQRPEAEFEAASDSGLNADAEPEPETSEAASQGGSPSGAAAFAVAATGVIDIVPVSSPDTATDDVDEDLASPEATADDDGRPWERREKTEADIEADRFFAAFDAAAAEQRGDDSAEPEGEASVDEVRTDEGGDQR